MGCGYGEQHRGGRGGSDGGLFGDSHGAIFEAEQTAVDTSRDYLAAPLYLAKTANHANDSFMHLVHRTTHQFNRGRLAPDGRGGHRPDALMNW
jgi:hypothetical protein